MSTNIQELYVSTVRPLPAGERRRLADLILQELAPLPKNGTMPDAVITQIPLSAAEREAKRQQSIAWIKAHRAEYGGLYVALDGDKLIGTGQRYGEVRAIARQKGYPDAFIGDVLPLDYEGYMGGWE